MVVVFGNLIQKTIPDQLDLEDSICFTGMGFGYEGVPIDIVTLLLAGINAKKYHLLLVDEFYRFNGMSEALIARGLSKIKLALASLIEIYQLEAKTILSSEIISSANYGETLNEITDIVNQMELESALLSTVPEKHKHSPNPLQYPLNEIACVKFFIENFGTEVKIGPKKEQVYDEIMEALGFTLSFAYVTEAYALGTREPEEVIHYIPSSRGQNNGQRLFFEDSIQKARSKLLMGPEKAQRQMLELASYSGFLLGKEYLTLEQINEFQKKKLRKATARYTINNILEPYNEVAKDEY